MSVVWLWIACAPEKPDESDAPPINGGHEPADCAVNPDDACEEAFSCTAPVIADLRVVNGGEAQFDDGVFWTVQIDADGEDTDGDLHNMRMTVWADDLVDGTVDTTGEGTVGGFAQMRDVECTTYVGGYGLGLGVNGAQFEYDTLYEFAAIVYDAFDTASEPVIASGYTPKADGTDGGP